MKKSVLNGEQGTYGIKQQRMSVSSRLVATSRAVRLLGCGRQCLGFRGAHALAPQDIEVGERAWQVGEVGVIACCVDSKAGPSNWHAHIDNDPNGRSNQLLKQGAHHPVVANAVEPEQRPTCDSAGATPIGMRSHLKRPRNLPDDARALLDSLFTDQPAHSSTFRSRISELKKYQQAYMLAEIGRHLSRKLRVYAADMSQGPPWDDSGRALFKLLLPGGLDIPAWHDAEGRLATHHPVTAMLSSLARRFKFHPGLFPSADRNAVVLLDTLRQIPPNVKLAPQALVSVMFLLPMEESYHLLKAHLLTALLLATDTASSLGGFSSGDGLTPADATVLQEAIKHCTPKEQWKSVPDVLHQALLQAWKIVIDHTVLQSVAESPSPEHFTPAFLSLLLKLPGNESMHLPELLNAMRTLNVAITPFQTQLVLRYDSFLAPWMHGSGNPSEVLDKAWEGLLVRRKMQAAVDAHATGTPQALRSLELAWGEVVMTSYEAVRTLMSHERGASHPSASNEVFFWEEKVDEHQQRWRTIVSDALASSPDVETFSPTNMQGQALWLLLRYRLLVGSTSTDPLDDPRHLFQLSIGAGHRTTMQHTRVISCLIRLLVHYRHDIPRLVPCLDQVAGDITIKVPALLYQRILAACTTRRHVNAVLPCLLQMQPPDDDVFIRNKELRRLVCLAAETSDGLGQFLALLTHWRVDVSIGKVAQILRDYRARSESVEQAIAWESTRGE